MMQQDRDDASKSNGKTNDDDQSTRTLFLSSRSNDLTGGLTVQLQDLVHPAQIDTDPAERGGDMTFEARPS